MTFPVSRSKKSLALLSATLCLGYGALLQGAPSSPAPPALSSVPLGLAGGSTPNVLMVLDTSNSMDNKPDGSASWSGDPSSRSSIVRAAARSIVAQYGANMNLGLMSYQQPSDIYMSNLQMQFRGISFNPANYPSNYDSQFLNPPTGNTFYYNQVTSKVAYGYLGQMLYYSPNGTNNYYGVTQKTDTIDAPAGVGACWNSPPPYVFWIYGNTPYCITWSGINVDNGTGGSGGNLGYLGAWLASIQIGPVWLSTSTLSVSAGASYGYLHVPIAAAPPGSVQAGKINTKLQDPKFTYGGTPANCTSGTLTTSVGSSSLPVTVVGNASLISTFLNAYGRGTSSVFQPGDCGYWSNVNYPLENAGNTPIEGTLKTANAYFNKTLTDTTQGWVNATSTPYPTQGQCTKNFVVFLTDGTASTLAGGNPNGSSQPASTLNAGVTAAATSLLNSAAQVATYWIGFGSDVANGGTINTYAQASGTSTAYSAMDATSLNAAFSSIFASIQAQSSAASAVAVNSGQLSSNTSIYQASFKSGSWIGDLQAYAISTSGAVASAPSWSAASQLASSATGYAARMSHIYTYNNDTKSGGLVFSAYGSLSTSEKAALATGQQTLMNYLAGASANEGTGTGQYRIRTSRLGDIINSAPVYVGVPQQSYSDTFEAVAYSTFVNSQKSRTPTVYVGANDGMLHAFNANTGGETFAYIPSMVFANLPNLAMQNYSHTYYVDGSPISSDAFWGGAWHTVLVGGLNAGGKGIYALDVTNPGSMSVSSVLWEFTNTQTSSSGSGVTLQNYDGDLGFTFSAPTVAKVAYNGSSTGYQWVAIFGNGYNNTQATNGVASSTGDAVLYVVNLQTGALIRKIDTGYGWQQDPTGQGRPNGLSTPAVVDTAGNNIADAVYAGDLQGHLWKFDLTSSNPAQWGVAYGSNGAPQPLFTATDVTGRAQPITDQPEVGQGPVVSGQSLGGAMVYFGTGESFLVNDLSAPVARPNSFYGIWDKGQAVAGRAQLQQQTVVTVQNVTVNGTTTAYRQISDNPLNYNAQSGWYLDFPTDTSSSPPLEMVLSHPQLDSGRIVFTTTIPSAAAATSQCATGGSSWLMELDPYTGSATSTSPFDVNQDGSFNAQDNIFKTILDNGILDNVPPGGMQLQATASQPTILNGSANKVKIVNLGSGGLQSIAESKGAGSGRTAWRAVSTPSN